MDIRKFMCNRKRQAEPEDELPQDVQDVLQDHDVDLNLEPTDHVHPKVTPPIVCDLGTLESGPAKPRNKSYHITIVNNHKRSFLTSLF